jgi:molybdate transport system permease protein
MHKQRVSRGDRVFRGGVYSGLAVLVGSLALVLASVVLYVDWATFSRTILSDEIRAAIRLTAITSTITTALAVVLAVPAGYALSRFRIPGAAIIDTIIDLPIILPDLVAGIALLVFFTQTALGQYIDQHIIPFVFTLQGIILAQFFPAVTLAVRSMKGAFDAVDPRLEKVARTLGCDERVAFARVTFPLARGGLIAGTVLTWARAAGLFGPIIMFCGATRYKTEVLSIAIFLNMSSGRIEVALAVTVILMLLGVVTLTLFKRLGGRGYIW